MNYTIHIFGYGETQINSKDFSIKVKTSDLTKVDKLVTAIYAQKPDESEAEEVYHAINIFSGNKISYVSKNGFSIKITEALQTDIDDLVAELRVLYDALPQVDEKSK